ncbi:WXG100 family type VII secretion target [Nocardia jejuensis]|uniref:WXG100 family type VII secretion target n=1 Tax=Nocardia jejuensis TaxID=328049 RepID=UPI0009FF7494|nr:WXG100 family type VII secretion target [Nocardia jejuensis]
MSEEFSVDLNDLDAIVTRLSDLANFIGDQLSDLDRKVAAVRSGSWDSAGAVAYADAHSEWLSGAKELAEGVTDMGVVARNAHGHYTAAIGANTRMFGGK